MSVEMQRFVEQEPLLREWPLAPFASSCPQEVSAQIVTYGSGEIVFYGGAPVLWIYWILSGKVNCGMSSMLSVSHNFIVLNVGDSFGEYEAIGQRMEYFADIIAATNLTVVRLEREAYLSWLMADHNLMLARYRTNVLELLAQSFNSHLTRFMSSVKRLAMFLSRYFELNSSIEHMKNPAFPLLVKLRQEDISQEIGVNIRTLARSLKDLESKNFISRKNRKISITKQQVLAIRAYYYNDEN